MIEQFSTISEASSQPQDLALEARCKASHEATLARVSGCTSNPQPQQGRKLGVVGENMLQEMFLPGQNSIWTEADVLEKLNLLNLVPKQQSTLEYGIRLDQFGLDKTSQ